MLPISVNPYVHYSRQWVKPFIDLIFFSVYLRDNLGTGGNYRYLCQLYGDRINVETATPSFGKLSSQRAHLEGIYYNQHLNVMTNSEEIGFYKGSLIEKFKLNENFQN